MRLPTHEEIRSLKRLGYTIKEKQAEIQEAIALYEKVHMSIVKACDVPPDAIYSIYDNKWQIKKGQQLVDVEMSIEGDLTDRIHDVIHDD